MQLVTAARGARRLESPLSAAVEAPRAGAQQDKSVRLSLLNAFALVCDGVEVDVRRGLAHARRLLAGAGVDVDVDGDDAALHGELLPDWYDDWVLFERERYRQLALHALEAQAERLQELGRPPEALQRALAAVRSEPLRESGHRLLIRVHLAEGNAVEALRQFELCRRLLRDRLGLDPSPQLVELVAPLTR